MSNPSGGPTSKSIVPICPNIPVWKFSYPENLKELCLIRFGAKLSRAKWVCFFISWYVVTFVPIVQLYLGNVVGLQIDKNYYWLGVTQYRVKLIRVWLGDSDGLGALLNVCIWGSQPPTCSCSRPNTIPHTATVRIVPAWALFLCPSRFCSRNSFCMYVRLSHSVSRILTAP